MLDQFILENWYRFLDYCETPLDKTKIDPNRLLEILYFINPSIKFKMETSNKELPFLLKETMIKYVWIFILIQQTLDGVSHYCPAIRTIVRKT